MLGAHLGPHCWPAAIRMIESGRPADGRDLHPPAAAGRLPEGPRPGGQRQGVGEGLPDPLSALGRSDDAAEAGVGRHQLEDDQDPGRGPGVRRPARRDPVPAGRAAVRAAAHTALARGPGPAVRRFAGAARGAERALGPRGRGDRRGLDAPGADAGARDRRARSLRTPRAVRRDRRDGRGQGRPRPSTRVWCRWSASGSHCRSARPGRGRVSWRPGATALAGLAPAGSRSCSWRTSRSGPSASSGRPATRRSRSVMRVVDRVRRRHRRAGRRPRAALRGQRRPRQRPSCSPTRTPTGCSSAGPRGRPTVRRPARGSGPDQG